jgi:hypothetical protein
MFSFAVQLDIALREFINTKCPVLRAVSHGRGDILLLELQQRLPGRNPDPNSDCELSGRCDSWNQTPPLMSSRCRRAAPKTFAQVGNHRFDCEIEPIVSGARMMMELAEFLSLWPSGPFVRTLDQPINIGGMSRRVSSRPEDATTDSMPVVRWGVRVRYFVALESFRNRTRKLDARGVTEGEAADLGLRFRFSAILEDDRFLGGHFVALERHI